MNSQFKPGNSQLVPIGFHCETLIEIKDRVVSNQLSYVELNHLYYREMQTIRSYIESHGLRVGVHCPLVLPEWFPFPATASFLSGDASEELRKLNLRLISQTLQESRLLGAEYVVVHFPKPALDSEINPGVNPSMEIAWDSAEQLARLAFQYDIRICIESFGEPPFLSAGFLMEVLDKFPQLAYCFDVGHIHLASIRGVLDYFEFLKRLAPRIGTMHLWNTRGSQDYAVFSHLPIHPSQEPAAGWADIPRTLRIVMEANPQAVVILEHGTIFPKHFALDYQEGVEWVKRILNEFHATGPDTC